MTIRKVIRCIPLGLTILAAACQSAQNVSLDLNAFPFSSDPDMTYLTRNGDNIRKTGVSYSYDEVSRPGDPDNVIGTIRGGQSALILLHQDNCETCRSAHDNLTSFFIRSGVDLFSFHFVSGEQAKTLDALNQITATFPSYSSVMHDYLTPSIFLLKNPEKAYFLNFLPERSSTQNLDSFFKNVINFSLVFTFRTYEAFAAFSSNYDCLAYVDSGEGYYQDGIYPKAVSSSRFTAHIQKSFFSEEDQKALTQTFGENDLGLFVSGKFTQATNAKKSPDVAGRIISDYYR